ncbi:MAG: hypothetical protein IIC60_02105 [Proteobacteria bacterium]|nr:hypothetical protein [Pseudomonadota bacterium]
MRKSRFSDGQILAILKQNEHGVIPGASSAEVIAFVQNKNLNIRVVVCSG